MRRLASSPLFDSTFFCLSPVTKRLILQIVRQPNAKPIRKQTMRLREIDKLKGYYCCRIKCHQLLSIADQAGDLSVSVENQNQNVV